MATSQERAQSQDVAVDVPVPPDTLESPVPAVTSAVTDSGETDQPTTDPVVSLVMPTMNEADGIADCIARARAAFEELGVPGEIVVSDSSTDATPHIARHLGARVVTPDRRGYGYAYRYAFPYVRGEYVVIGDADTTYDFNEIPRLLAALREQDADMVLGSRFAGHILPGAMPPLHQYVGNPGLTAVLNLLYDARISDAHSGFRIVRRDALASLDLRSEGMEFASEMLMAATADGLRVVEVPITYHVRAGEATLASFRDGWRHVKFMFLNAPGTAFALPGTVLGLVGLAVLSLALLGGAGVLATLAPTASVTLAAAVSGGLLLLAGAQLVGLAFVVRVAGQPIREPNGPLMRWLVDHFSVERGLLSGVLLGGLGLASTAVAATAAVPPTLSVAGLTALALGIHVGFVSLLVGALERR